MIFRVKSFFEVPKLNEYSSFRFVTFGKIMIYVKQGEMNGQSMGGR